MKKDDKISCKLITERIIDYCYKTTQTMRTWMEENPNLAQPTNYREYPGKLDHTTCVVIQATYTDLKEDLNEMEKFVIKLRNPIFGIKTTNKINLDSSVNCHDASFKGFELIQWVKENYKNSNGSLWEEVSDERAHSLSQQLLNLSHIIPLGGYKNENEKYKIEEFDLDTLYCFKTFDPIMTESDWLQIHESAQVRYYSKGETLVFEDEKQNNIYQVVSGKCLISRSVYKEAYSLNIVESPKKRPRSRSSDRKGGTVNRNRLVRKKNIPQEFIKQKKIEKEQKILGYINEPETFGEISFLTDTAATASIIADSDMVMVHEFDRDMLNIAFNRFPELAARFYHFIGTIILRMVNQ